MQEIAGLQRDDILERHEPPVLVVTAGKGDRERVVPLHPDVLAALRVFGMPKQGPVFIGSRTGAQLSPAAMSHAVGRYFRSLGIDATGHQLRHWFGTNVYRTSGKDLRATQELLGHSSPTTTAIYAAWNPTDALNAVVALAAGPVVEDTPPVTKSKAV
jgi:integrase